MVQSRQACSNDSMSNWPSGRRKVIRFRDARLQAVSSRNMYSEHGFDALIRPEAGQVCHSLMVVSNCTPGSAQAQAASPILSHNACGSRVALTLPSVRRVSCQGSPCAILVKNTFGTRTELFEF